MLAKVIIENGQKKIQALTADTGTGAPVGSYLYLEKKSNPQGYLYCDGSTFDETAYPALYQYLGTNVLPDWRELGAKGAEKNTTLIFDSTETDPSTGQAGTQNHDVFTQGEFKDDQLQNHQHEIGNDNPSGQNVGSVNGWFQSGTIRTGNVENARKGTVTRGKSRAVFIYIKATSGLTENQQENVLNTINENLSYSTEEHPTGAKWIDGKPIYSKTFTGTTTNTGFISVANLLSLNIDKVLLIDQIFENENYVLTSYYYGGSNTFRALIQKSNMDLIVNVSETNVDYKVTIEYTKTTDN